VQWTRKLFLDKDVICSAEVRGKKVFYCVSEVATDEMLMKKNALQ
jgi:hypothetical protein